MKIAISAETTIDLTEELIKKFDFKIVPFSVTMGNVTKYDGDVSAEELFKFVEKSHTLPKTGAVNNFQFEEHFKKIFEEGYDAIIHFSLSSKLSSAYSNALYVSKNFKNVFVVDTKTLSTGIANLAIYAHKLIQKAKDDVETIYKKVLERVPHNQASFVVDSLDYLYKGGRCSSLQRFGANLLRIKPQIILTTEGRMISGKSYRGNLKGVVKKYCVDTLQAYTNPDYDHVFVTCSSNNPDLFEVCDEVLVGTKFKNVYHTIAGATIGAHCGPDTIGILFLNDGNHED